MNRQDGCERMESVGFSEKHTSLKLVDYHYRITKKELHQIAETSPLKDFP